MLVYIHIYQIILPYYRGEVISVACHEISDHWLVLDSATVCLKGLSSFISSKHWRYVPGFYKETYLNKTCTVDVINQISSPFSLSSYT